MPKNRRPTPRRNYRKHALLASGALCVGLLFYRPDFTERLVGLFCGYAEVHAFTFPDSWSVDIRLAGETPDNRYRAAQTLRAEFAKARDTIDASRLAEHGLIRVNTEVNGDQWRVEYVFYEPMPAMTDANRSEVRFICESAHDDSSYFATQAEAETARKQATAQIAAVVARIIKQPSWKSEARFVQPVPMVRKTHAEDTVN